MFYNFISAIKKISILAVFVLALVACKNQDSTPTSKSELDTQSDTSEPNLTVKEEIELYAWVDKLKIRNTPSLKGKTVAIVQGGEKLKYSGLHSEDNEMIVLRGKLYDEPWFQVRTNAGVDGWVFGGAVKRNNEEKGNKKINDLNFNFPHFGDFNLKEWKKLDTKDESGGDADIKTTTYKRRSLRLEFSKVEVGDYGYQRIYKLIDANSKVVKERVFKFLADANYGEMIEEVKDFTVTPPVMYRRVQTIDKHYAQLNDRPLMVNGSWTTRSIKNTDN